MTTALALPTDDRTDSDLVAATRAGDDRAFERLYARYSRRVAGYAQSMVGDWAKAEDVTQEVFISALRRMRSTDRPISFRPWVFEIARNACIDHFRRTRRTDEVPLDGEEGGLEHALRAAPDSPETAAENGQRLDHLLGAFGSLAPSHHEILVLRELEGRSYREIAEVMGLSRPSVESTLFRARRRLEEEYDELATGRRCEGVTALIEDGARSRREERRLTRHLTFCRTCRRRALAAGVEPGPFARVARRAAAMLPLPAILRSRLLGGAGGDPAGSLAGLAAGPVGESAPGWGKGAVAAVALVVAGTGAGIATQAGSVGVLDRHVLPPAARSAPAGHDGAPADGRRHPRRLPATAGSRAGGRAHRHRAGAAGRQGKTAARRSGTRGAAATRPGRLQRAQGAGSSAAAGSGSSTAPPAPSVPSSSGGTAPSATSGGGGTSAPAPSTAGSTSTGGSSSSGGSSGGGVVGTTVGQVQTTVGQVGANLQTTTQQVQGVVGGTLGTVQQTTQAVTAPTQQVVGEVVGGVGGLLGR
jgi:RNA polymerase sigma factor (sigma-70 family)